MQGEARGASEGHDGPRQTVRHTAHRDAHPLFAGAAAGGEGEGQGKGCNNGCEAFHKRVLLSPRFAAPLPSLTEYYDGDVSKLHHKFCRIVKK